MRIKMEDLQKMRLYNAYYLCKQCEDGINELELTTIKPNQEYVIKNWSAYKESLSTVRQIPFLKNSIDDFYETIPVFVRERQHPEFDFDIRNQLANKKSEILSKIQTVIALYESMNLGENENGIDVKIPECDSLDTYIYYLREIDFIFSHCPTLKCSDGEIKFNTVDVGSQWVTFLIEATLGAAAVSYILKNLAMLVDKAVQVKSRINNLEQQKEIIKAQKLQNDVLNSNLEMFDTLKAHYLTEAVEAIEASNSENPLKDGEERGKLSKSLEKLCVLLDKGVEIHASIDTEHEIQVLFPAMEEKLELPENIIKFLEDTN